MSFSNWLGRRLVWRDQAGKPHPPGAGSAIRILEPDGGEIAAIARGDAFDLYFGRETFYNYSVTPKAAMRLAWWLVWWWVRHSWCGLRPRLWRWVQNSRAERRWKESG